MTPNDPLDDFELQPARDDERDVPTVERRRPSVFPLLLAALGVVVVGALAGYLALLQPWRSKAPEPQAAAPTSPPPARATATPREALPPLDASDAFVRGFGAGLSSHPELARWLGRASLVRTLTFAVTQIANGQTPRLELDFLAPQQRFRAAPGRSGRIVADSASYAAYDLFGDVIASVDAGAAAAAYRAAEPLFDAAHRELDSSGAFRPVLAAAIRELLAVPVPPADADLVPHASGFRWGDPRLEALTPAQKQLLRTGARNIRIVQAKLRELQKALEATVVGANHDGPRVFLA